MSTATRTVTVTAERGTGWWVLECAEAGSVSQCKRLDQAADEMREAIAHQMGLPVDGFDIEVVPVLPIGYRREVVAAEEARGAAQAANAAAAAHSRAAARALADAGLTVRDVGTVMGISHQRAAQLVAG
jgi:hypothetical protein